MKVLLLALLLTQDPPDLKKALARELLAPGTPPQEIQGFIEVRIHVPPMPSSLADWLTAVPELRKRVLETVILRGEARRWDQTAGQVIWKEKNPGNPGYSIQKLRYEAVPGLWIPALLYQPEGLDLKLPVHLETILLC